MSFTSAIGHLLLFFLLQYTIVEGQAECRNWCVDSWKPWFQKCTWRKCSQCSECRTSTRDCPESCSSGDFGWGRTCTENICKFCKACRRPNVLLILADDIGTGNVPGYWDDQTDLHLTSSIVEMENLSKLVSQGVRLTDMHSTPACAPSRYSLLSGNYVQRGSELAGTWKIGNRSQFRPGQQSLAQVLKDGANYHTGMFGKSHLGGVIPPHGASETSNDILTNADYDWTLPLGFGPQELGFDDSYITVGGIQGPPYSFFRGGDLDVSEEGVVFWESGSYETQNGISKISNRPGEGDPRWDSTLYNMILVNETVRFLDEHERSRRTDSFFAFVSLGNVHYPHSPPNFYLDGTPVSGRYENSFLDVLFEMDLVVGSLVQAIESRGLIEDTVIIFTSDNGGLTFSPFQNNGPLRGNKKEIWEGGHRVPFIARYDGVFPAGEELDFLAGFNDVFATICDLAGVEIPTNQAMDSISFAKSLQKPHAQSLRKWLPHWDFWPFKTGAEAIRWKNFKMVINWEDAKMRDNRAQVSLYDLKNDLTESHDLVSDPKYEDIVSEMLSELMKYDGELGRINPQERYTRYLFS